MQNSIPRILKTFKSIERTPAVITPICPQFDFTFPTRKQIEAMKMNVILILFGNM